MRTALEQIKFELGADAVIMSNKKIPEGVELMAAVDNHHTSSALSENHAKASANRDLSQDKVTLRSNPKLSPTITSSIQEQLDTPSSAPVDSLAALLNRNVQHQKNASSPTIEPEQSIEEQFKDFTRRLESQDLDTGSAGDSLLDQPSKENLAPVKNQPLKSIDSAEIIRMKNEMASIRQLLEHQVAGLLWQDMAQKNPNRALLVNRLQKMGISEQLADQYSGYISSHVNESEAWQQVTDLLIAQLNTTNNDIIRHGGVVSLVGPTGVGKTTTIAKLAARFAQNHGADSVALISTDTYRIAGFEQLSTYARIIGCQAKLAKDHQELDDLIQHFAGKKLVLIDTAGMGQRDIRLSQYLTTLIANARIRIRNYLVLSANTQQRVMQENVERFKKIPLAGCIFTKLDESISFGEIISTSIQNGLPIGYLTDGQRVPEDIKVANAEKLVRLAEKMTVKYANNASGYNNMPITSTACA